MHQMDGEVEGSKNSEIIDGASKISAAAGKDSSDANCGEEMRSTSNIGHCLIDVKGGSRNTENYSKDEKVCRICHFGREDSSSLALELIPLGCDCKGEIGSSHPHCAEVWFSQKGDRICEICGKTAKNIRCNADDETSIFMMDWNEMRLAAATLDGASRESLRRSRQSFCNLLLACLILAFLLLWLLRGINIL